ncbi:hypothetical protein [Hyphomonas oceanitis]|uniref:hypothetical protein n=1 Tax=Hyphomonas oceanitis TaxID=81033 RepID=UPI0012EC9FB6|nr:hypothetical protein [Hyphomonas oceanitis]
MSLQISSDWSQPIACHSGDSTILKSEGASALNAPNPIGLIYRIWIAIRQNPCTIEVINYQHNDGRQWIRVRNDSNAPIQLFDVDFRWREKGARKFTRFTTPMVWVLSSHCDKSLSPAHSFEHPVDVHELGENIVECEVIVTHNRSKLPTKKRFKPIYY